MPQLQLVFNNLHKLICSLILMSSMLSLAQGTNQDFMSSYFDLLSKDKNSALVFCDELINSNNFTKKAFGYAGKANIYSSKADYEKASDLFNKSKSLIEHPNSKIDQETKGNILCLQAVSYIERHNFEKALSILSNALDDCNGNCSFMLQNKLLSEQGRVYSMSRNNLKANLKSLDISREVLINIKRQSDFSTSYDLKKLYLKELCKASSRAINLYDLDKENYKSYLDSTKAYTIKAKEFATTHNISTYDGFITIYFADIDYIQNKFDTAKNYYLEALNIYLKKGSNKKVNQLRFRIAECDYKLGNFDVAEASFKKQIAENIWAQYPEIDFEAKCYDYLAEVYKQKGDLAQALVYMDAHLVSFQKYLDRKNDSDLDVNDKMHLEARKREVEELKKENEYQLRQKRLFTYISMALIVAVVLLTAFLVHKSKKTKQNINRLNERIAWLQENLSKETNVSGSSSLTDENALKLIAKLKELEKEALFTEPSYNLNMVAKRLNTNSSYLSKTVNDYMNISFVEYSNRLKINSIVQKLNNQKSLRNYTIKALAREAGYKSVNAFNSNFKKLLKVTPSQYLANLEAN